jgi:Uma2 family endonuclease
MRPSQASAVERPQKITYEEFLEWCDEDTLAEWVDGDIVMTSPASYPHQALVGFLATILGTYVEQRELGLIIIPPFQMKTGPHLSGREPDLIFLASAHLSRLTKTYLDGPADLVIEVVSPESRLRDRGEKLAEYEIGGVREYWIIDPEEQRADFFVLAEDGRYERKRVDAEGVYRSAVVPGFWLREAWLWQDPPPKALTVLHELGVV